MAISLGYLLQCDYFDPWWPFCSNWLLFAFLSFLLPGDYFAPSGYFAPWLLFSPQWLFYPTGYIALTDYLAPSRYFPSPAIFSELPD